MSEEIEGDPVAHEDAIGRLLNALRSGGPSALGLARSHLPGLERASNSTLRARGFELEDAELAHARHFGFDSWPELRAELFRAGLEPRETGTPFARAAVAVQAADRRRLTRELEQHPAVLEAGAGGRLDPLLHQAVACRDEEAVRLLLEAGADPMERAPCGCTAVHRAAYGHPPEARPSPQRVHRRILALFLRRGAEREIEAHGEGGTPLAMALFWGHRPLAELLVEHGARVPNLRSAAALGDLDACRAFLPGGRPGAGAGEGRGFYRPHEGFPEHRPTDDPQEILDEALVWAARSGRQQTLALLIEHGARIDACPYDAPALVHVAASGPLATVRWLLEQGADPDARGRFPRGATALHLAAAQGHLEAVRVLLKAGASRRLEDEEFGTDALGYAEWGGHADIIELLGGR